MTPFYRLLAGGIGYIILGKSLRSSMPVLFFMVLNMTTASFMILLFSWSIGTEFTWGRHVNHGVFGWMNLQGDRLPLELGTVFVVSQYLGCSFIPIISLHCINLNSVIITVQLTGNDGVCSRLPTLQQYHYRSRISV